MKPFYLHNWKGVIFSDKPQEWNEWLTHNLDFETWMTAGCFRKNCFSRSSSHWSAWGIRTKMPDSHRNSHITPTREAFQSGRQGQVWDLTEARIHPVWCAWGKGTVLDECAELGKYFGDSLRSMHVCSAHDLWRHNAQTTGLKLVNSKARLPCAHNRHY